LPRPACPACWTVLLRTSGLALLPVGVPPIIAAVWAGLHKWCSCSVCMLLTPATFLHTGWSSIHGSCLFLFMPVLHQPPCLHPVAAALIHGSGSCLPHQPPSPPNSVARPFASRLLLLEPEPLPWVAHVRLLCPSPLPHSATFYSHPHPFHVHNFSIVASGHAPRPRAPGHSFFPQ